MFQPALPNVDHGDIRSIQIQPTDHSRIVAQHSLGKHMIQHVHMQHTRQVVLLKNEFGDVEGISDYPFLPRSSPPSGYTLMEQLIVDSQLAKQSSLTAVNEILNGCL